uniref:Condensin complex subunit 2 n=1 Tax=Parascaris equorum TaxID=6256 RepID=A0A914RBM8_PAREQ
MLDASARVYSFRVDVTHSEACDVRMKLGDQSSDSEEECDDSGGGIGNLEKTTVEKEGRSKQGIKESADVEEDTDDEAASRSVQDAFDVSDLPVFLTEPDPVDDSDTE